MLIKDTWMGVGVFFKGAGHHGVSEKMILQMGDIHINLYSR